jgi:hypothetical protein
VFGLISQVCCYQIFNPNPHSKLKIGNLQFACATPYISNEMDLMEVMDEMEEPRCAWGKTITIPPHPNGPR